jgi:hypothetical protein
VAYGTLTTLDTLKATYQTVAEFGEDRAFESIQALLDAHNQIVQTMYTDIVDRTTDRLRRYGTTDSMTMVKTDEMGRPDAQKILPGAVAGFPLESFQATLQWTRKYFQNAQVAEVAGQFLMMRTADLQRIQLEIKRALFSPTNYNFDDYLVDRLQQIPLPVRALLNADGLGIPAGPNGETFDGTTHTHYLATASFVAADLVAALETVLEHYNTGDAMIYINRAQETAIRGFTANFTAMLNAQLVGATTATQVGPGQPRLSAVPIYNRQIGIFNGAEVWVKPWIPASYILVLIKGQPKPLVLRTRPGAGNGDLQLVADDERYPFRARTYEREFGVGVWNRTAASCLYVGGGSYVAPTLAA